MRALTTGAVTASEEVHLPAAALQAATAAAMAAAGEARAAVARQSRPSRRVALAQLVLAGLPGPAQQAPHCRRRPQAGDESAPGRV